MTRPEGRLHVSLIAIPDAVLSTLGGIYDVLNGIGASAGASPFAVEIVSEAGGEVRLASGLPIACHRALSAVAGTDIVIIPSLIAQEGVWQPGRYPALVDWLKARHREGATLCSACSGVFLLAETGLLDGREATIHWSYARAFRAVFPAVRLDPEKVLIAAGAQGEFVMSGATTSWHDLVLYLTCRHAGPEAAQAVARFYALQWHRDGLAPYVVFEAPTDHGDAAVAEAQTWLGTHFTVTNPVVEIVRRSGLPERSFKRRFTKATGDTPIGYVQRLRVEEAKRRLERSGDAVDAISWQVGYEDPAFFRRLFKRVTGVTPGAYRRRFQIPAYAVSSAP